jgi:enamine deaminase RidA (YjgF/YER057c/UK114 family)
MQQIHLSVPVSAYAFPFILREIKINSMEKETNRSRGTSWKNVLVAVLVVALAGTSFTIFKNKDMGQDAKAAQNKSIGQDAHAPSFINPAGLYDPSPNAYAHIAVVPAGNTLVFIAGQGGETADGNLVNDFRAQVKQVFRNLEVALESQGLTFKDVVKQTTLVVDHNPEKLKILTEESLLVWPDKQFPTNTLIPVPGLALTGMLIEIDVTAVKR